MDRTNMDKALTLLVVVVAFVVMLGSVRPLQQGFTWPVDPGMLGLGVSLLTFAIAFWDKSKSRK